MPSLNETEIVLLKKSSVFFCASHTLVSNRYYRVYYEPGFFSALFDVYFEVFFVKFLFCKISCNSEKHDFGMFLEIMESSSPVELFF